MSERESLPPEFPSSLPQSLLIIWWSELREVESLLRWEDLREQPLLRLCSWLEWWCDLLLPSWCGYSAAGNINQTYPCLPHWVESRTEQRAIGNPILKRKGGVGSWKPLAFFILNSLLIGKDHLSLPFFRWAVHPLSESSSTKESLHRWLMGKLQGADLISTPSRSHWENASLETPMLLFFSCCPSFAFENLGFQSL